MASSSTDFGLVSPTYAWMDNGRDLVVSTVCLNALEHIEKPEIMQTWHSLILFALQTLRQAASQTFRKLDPQNLVVVRHEREA